MYGLAEYYDITLLIDNYKLENKQLANDFPVVIYKHGKSYTGFDAVIYNIGNNPWYHSYMVDAMEDNPGYIILHDYVLYYLTVGVHQRRCDLFQTIYTLEGVQGINTVKDSIKQRHEPDLLLHTSIASELHMNQEVIMMSKGVLVHSSYTKDLVNRKYPEKPCCKIDLINMSLTEASRDYQDYKNNCYKIPEDAFVIGSVGFIAPTKQNELCCKTVRLYNQTHSAKIYYLMIGEGTYVDRYLDRYIIKTDFLNTEDYLCAIERCNLILNLRYPTNGETSATLIQCMGKGKACIVTDIGWFKEIPDDSVVKIPWNITSEGLLEVIDKLKNSDNIQIKRRAKEYVDTVCAVEKVTRVIKDFMKY